MARPATGAGAAVTRGRNAVATVFTLSGFLLASWLSRLPHIRDHLDLTAGQLGQVVLVGSVGAVGSLPLAGLVVGRIGPRRTVVGALLAASLGVGLVALGAGPWSSPMVAAGLLVAGYGMGTWDVAMNVEGAEVERRLGRTLMPRLHAGFSLGTVIGAGLGALAAAVELPVPVHLLAASAATAAIGVVACRSFLPDGAPTASAGHGAGEVDRAGAESPAMAKLTGRTRSGGLRAAWREPRTLLMGVMVLAFALGEGIANDWLAIGLVDGYEVSNATGALGFAVFVTAMTAFRLGGTFTLDRYGRTRMLRVSAALIAAGVLLVVFGGALPVAMAGAVLWGAGSALGFPVGMSAAADDPVQAPARVSVVSSIAYTAFLAGPPALGWLGDRFGVDRALLAVLVAAAVGGLTAGVTRPRRGRHRSEVVANRVDAARPV
jgi:MFS family permease